MTKFILSKFLRAFLSLLIAGLLIGFLHPYDKLLASILAVVLVLFLYREIKKDKTQKKAFILISGSIICAIGGVVGEMWGIANEYWTYHNLPDGREFPYWLPFAWALTFCFFYRFESKILVEKTFRTYKSKLLFVAFVSATLPTWGEIVTIYLGVWTYHWPYQFLGVPLLAIILLMVFHSAIYIGYSKYCRKNNIINPVFNPKDVS